MVGQVIIRITYAFYTAFVIQNNVLLETSSAMTLWGWLTVSFYPKTFHDVFQIRAANLSGDCAFQNEAARFNFGFKQHQQVPTLGKITFFLACFRFEYLIWSPLWPQACVRGRALRSILAVRNISREEAEKIVDEVFDTCFNDHAPFGRIPHSKKDARFAYRDYENRDRYYANL